MSARPFPGQDPLPVRCVFDRRLFIALAIHWGLLVIAVPVFVFISNKSAFSIYMITAFISFFALTLTKPTRYLLNSGNRVICAELTVFSNVLQIIMIPLALLVLFGFIMLRNGMPRIYNSVYCLWDGGFIREISQKEYIRLFRIERTFHTSILALIRSVFMLCCCHTDQIV